MARGKTNGGRPILGAFRRRSTALITAIAALAVVAGVISPLPSTPAAEAASAADWDPGYIIDDSIFYDGNSMTATDVQNFLNSKVSSCVAGYTCLRNYGQATGSIGVDRYCAGYGAWPYESAAQIIDHVARSCNVSQRVLLVLLEKEQGLVSSRSPSARAYTAATGMGCPDTAPCDPNLGGFFYQVYYAARQYQIYRLNPTSFNHRAGQWNNIRISPNASCGTQRVYIYNQATAGLYNYTPYVPNGPALSNLYGTGDDCSAYGNRNFWRMFTDWFGNPRSYSVHPGLQSYWSARGGASGYIGAPTSYPIFIEQNGQGWSQRFSGGTIYASYQGGTAFVGANSIAAEYARQGDAYGSFGFPNGEQVCTADARCAQSFAYASITTSNYGAHSIIGGLREYWIAQGGVGGALGSALNDLSYFSTAAGTAWQQNFSAGILVQSSAGGVQLVPYSPVLNYWLTSGGGAGWLGWPTGSYTCGTTGCSQAFSSGAVLATGYYGAVPVSGGFVSEWAKRGGVQGTLGAPISGLRQSSAPSLGWAQSFAGGILTQSSSGFVLIPWGPSQGIWSSAGESAGYGWPTTERTCDARNWCAQQFTYGVISESSYGAYGTSGGLGQFYKSQPNAQSTIGPALTPLRYSPYSGTGWQQNFAGGIITQASAGIFFTPYGKILDVWNYYGAERTWLGWPAGAQTCSADGACVQRFQNGVARVNSAGAVSFASS